MKGTRQQIYKGLQKFLFPVNNKRRFSILTVVPICELQWIHMSETAAKNGGQDILFGLESF
jgi:hypothetical protein